MKERIEGREIRKRETAAVAERKELEATRRATVEREKLARFETAKWEERARLCRTTVSA